MNETTSVGPVHLELTSVHYFNHRCVRCEALVERVITGPWAIGWCQACFEDEYGPDEDYDPPDHDPLSDEPGQPI